MASGGGLPHPLLPPPIHSPLHGHPGLGGHHFPQMPPIQSRPSSMPPTPSTPTYSGEYNFVEDIVVDPKSEPEDIVVGTTSKSTANSE